MPNPKVYKGRGETAVEYDVARKRIDLQNSTKEGVLRNIIEQHFSVDYLKNVNEFEAQVLRVIEKNEFRNFRSTSNSLLDKLIEGAASAVGLGEKRYIVRVFAVDELGLPPPNEFGTSERNTVNDVLVSMHGHHEMISTDSTTYKVGDRVTIRFNNNYMRTDGIIIKKSGDSPKKPNNNNPNSPQQFANPSGEFNNEYGGTIGCPLPNNPTPNAGGGNPTPQPPVSEQVKEIERKIKSYQDICNNLLNKIETLKNKSPRNENEETEYKTANKNFEEKKKNLNRLSEEYKKLTGETIEIAITKQERISEIENKIVNSQEMIKNININLQAEKNKKKPDLQVIDSLEEQIQEEVKMMITYSFEKQKIIDPSLQIPTEYQTISNPPEDPKPCSPSVSGNGARSFSGPGKYAMARMPTPAQEKAMVKELVKALYNDGWTNANFIAAVCANIKKETGFRVRNEYSYSTASLERLRKIWPGFKQMPDEELKALQKDDVAFYDRVYGINSKGYTKKAKNGKTIEIPSKGETFGNDKVGDGWKYRGRGYIGYTGKNLYTNASRAIFGNDTLLNDPELANRPDVNAKFLSFYFKKTALSTWIPLLKIDIATADKDQCINLVTSSVAGQNVKLSSENEKKTNKDGGIWTEIFNKVNAYFPKYLQMVEEILISIKK